MRKTLTLLAGTALAAGLAAPAMAQQTLTFSNSNPSVTVPLLSGSTLGIQTNGNVTAQCQLDVNNRCVGLPSGGSGGTAPTVSLAASGFSTTPDTQGKYSSGTTFSLTATVTNGEVCTRNIVSGTPTGTGWTGTLLSPFGTPTLVTLNAASTTFNFNMECYGDGGSATSSNYSVSTNAGVIIPPGSDQCASPIAPPNGFALNSPPDSFDDLRTVSGGFIGNFPNTGGALGQLAVPRAKFVSIKFTAPLDPNAYVGLARRFTWQESQTIGEALLNHTYVTVSQCPGDFRAPPAGNAPANDQTFARGCRNLRPGDNINGVNYAVSASGASSTQTMCNLKLGNTYYFNVILANPLDVDGIAVGEHNCLNPNLGQCGIQMKAE